MSNPTKGRGAKCIPIIYHRLHLRLLAIFHCRWKNTLRLKSRHIIALSFKETKERSYTRTTHSKTLKSSSPVCIQIGLNTLEELDYVGPKNCKFRRVPKVLAQAKPPFRHVRFSRPKVATEGRKKVQLVSSL